MSAGRRIRRALGLALAATMLAGVIAGCGGRGAGRGTAGAPGPARLRYVAEHAQKTYGNCGGGDDCTRIKLRWPLFTVAPGSPAVDSLNQFVRVTLLRPYDGGAPLPNEDSVMIGFIDAYRGFAGSAPGGPGAHGWQFERRIELMGDTLGVASLAVTESGFLGGAHPNSTTRFASFDVASGRALGLWDLLRGDARDSLDAAGERAFRRVRKLAPDADLVAAGFWFEGGRFKLNDNFAVSPTGLLFFFNAYEVGPHSLGATSLSVPWAEVMPLVRPDGRLAGRGGS